jgi:hypothetical protein
MEPVLDKTRARRDFGMQSNEFEAVFLGEGVEMVQEILKGCYIWYLSSLWQYVV